MIPRTAHIGGSAGVQPHCELCPLCQPHAVGHRVRVRHILPTPAPLSNFHGSRHALQSNQRGGAQKHAAQSLKSWTSSNSSPGRHGQIWLQPLRSDEVWYLGYGSNMNPQVLSGRRRVRPQHSLPCYVPGYVLSFGVHGFPWAEPGFATIQGQQPGCFKDAGQGSSYSSWRRRVQACNTPCLHGVLHRITRREWALIKATEGVVGDRGTGVGYQACEVDCVLYDDTTVVKAVTLQAATASLHEQSRDVQPSARYLRLLQKGSRHHGIDRHYQEWLDSLQPYQPQSTFGATLGSLASGMVLASAASTAVPAYVLSRAFREGSSQPAQQTAGGAAVSDSGEHTVASEAESEANRDSPIATAPPTDLLPFLRWYTSTSQKLVWDVHDSLTPWLGSGSTAAKS